MNRRPLVSAGFVLGVGLGGFIDGIVFHQLLQLHSMMSASTPRDTVVGLEVNMFWDGVFHLFCLLFTLAGVLMLVRAAPRREVPWSGEILSGAMLLGWGAFNLIEGVINHHVLSLHHVVESHGLSAWDYAFLLSGGALIAAGIAVIRGAQPVRPATGRNGTPELKVIESKKKSKYIGNG